MHSQHERSESTEVRKKMPYVSPVLIEYGNIVMITRASAMGPNDGGDGIDDPIGTA